MSQHFLRSAAYRDLTLASIYALSDQEIHDLFARLRWNSTTHQACPACGVFDRHHLRRSRQQWRCKACGRDFSVTSATVFANRKKPLRSILIAAFFFVTGVKGIASLGLGRMNDCSMKAAHALQGKLRESILRTQDLRPLTGVVEIDGGYFGGKPRKPNCRGRRNDKLIVDRLTGRLGGKRHAGLSRRNQDKRRNKRVVMVLRQRGTKPRQGAVRTITAVTHSENERDILHLVRQYVSPDARIETDDNPSYNCLAATHEHEAVRHGREYVRADGVNDNQAESYFTRLRRWELGVGHGVHRTYLADYAAEMGWREDHRRHTIRQQVEGLLTKALRLGHSRWWRGYYQGKRRGKEILMNKDVNHVDLSNGGNDQ